MGIRKKALKKKMAVAGWGTSKELLVALNREKLEVPTMQELYMWRRRGVIRFRSKRFPPKGKGAPLAMYPIPEIVSQVKSLREQQGLGFRLLQIADQAQKEYLARSTSFKPESAEAREKRLAKLMSGMNMGEELAGITAKVRRLLSRALLYLERNDGESAGREMAALDLVLRFEQRGLAWVLRNSKIEVDAQKVLDTFGLEKEKEEQSREDERMNFELLAEFFPEVPRQVYEKALGGN